MKKQAKLISAIVLAIIVSIGGYYAYQKYSLNKRVRASYKMRKDNGVKLNNTDKVIIDEILKNGTDLEYSYISHNGNTVMLTLKFKKSIKAEDRYSTVNKYMDKVRVHYKDKDINATIISNN